MNLTIVLMLIGTLNVIMGYFLDSYIKFISNLFKTTNKLVITIAKLLYIHIPVPFIANLHLEATHLSIVIAIAVFSLLLGKQLNSKFNDIV
ncbi:MAG: hypothetical protein JXR48_10215 [Candidatus Delongbacteria bacterium]|nr:hypothetical protein [Candidatus Delongbacteria bacterium]MBN2835329.1 hypothetical protein [Candidatus Delongbacteria bacterium]